MYEVGWVRRSLAGLFCGAARPVLRLAEITPPVWGRVGRVGHNPRLSRWRVTSSASGASQMWGRCCADNVPVQTGLVELRRLPGEPQVSPASYQVKPGVHHVAATPRLGSSSLRRPATAETALSEPARSSIRASWAISKIRRRQAVHFSPGGPLRHTRPPSSTNGCGVLMALAITMSRSSGSGMGPRGDKGRVGWTLSL